MADKSGRLLGGCSFVLDEADCSDLEIDSDDESDKENVPNGQDMCNSFDAEFIDNAPLAQGNTLALFQSQVAQAGKQKVNYLKRKLHLESSELGTVGRAVLQPVNHSTPAAKRRLFECSSSENEVSYAASPAAANTQVFRNQNSGSVGGSSGFGSQASVSQSQQNSNLHLQILKSKNSAACKLAVFKFVYAASFCDLTRPFKNDKTTNYQWVAAVFGVSEELFEASKQLLGRSCTYLHATCRAHEKGSVALLLLSFHVAKSRETVTNLLKNLLNLRAEHMMLQPPKLRGVTSAMFWYKMTLSPNTYTWGQLPRWIEQQILITENSSEVLKFDFSHMVQWALDNEMMDESSIAFHYAQMADHDSNARAWLGLSNQAKIVKDVCTMVHHYQRAIMRSMTMSAYVHKMCERVNVTGSWLVIMQFLKFHGIEPIRFVNALRPWLQGVPKKNCLAFIGPPDTGKSLFTNSLMSFLKGKVLNFANSASHFWLAPLTEAKVALIDDATHACLKYCDTYLRNFFDGYSVCIDRKHKNAVQIKAPPMLLTSNIDIQAEEKYSYLKSRVTCFYFNDKCPLNEDGKPLFQITDPDWKSFFERLWQRLELSDQEEEEEGDENGSRGTFICSTRNSNDFT
uniref:Replication protein E1 n=1 Tax=Bovine papillomavirus type 5 TaxID=2491661 RepID=VE1_BPV5|nr:RecName: Full=Replication protein E1; AltName: Full=ATP-dependent helicase E1 [Bos taurus papillomavirus 5]CAF05673.1 E1 protein [Epsilonpapillomavirus 1]